MRALFFVVVLAIISPWCGTIERAKSPEVKPVTAGEPTNTLKVMFWWWTPAEWQAGIDMLNPPKKTVYSELTKWEYADMEDSRYPHEVDLIAIFKNSRSLGRGEVRFFASGRYADLESIHNYNEDTDEAEFSPSKFEKLPWLNEELFASEIVDMSSTDDEITVSKELHLDRLLTSKSGNKHICGVRVRMEFVNAEGIVAASNEAWFLVKLGD